MKQFIICLLAGVLFLGGCAAEKTDKLQIVATTGIIGDVVREIGGTHVQVSSLMGPGVDPHLYRASEGDVAKLSRAKVIFFNGLHLEAKMGDVLESMHSRQPFVIAVTQDYDESGLLAPPEFEGLFDPHVWFDVRIWIRACETILATLREADPVHKSYYDARAKAYIESLKALDLEIRELVKRVPYAQRVIVSAHDAFNYFGKAYGFEVRGLQGISTASEAGTRDVQDLAQFIADRKIRAIFVESSVPVRNIEAVKRAVKAKGWDVRIGGELFSDALGSTGTLEGTYIGMVRHNVRTIVEALAGNQDEKE